MATFALTENGRAIDETTDCLREVMRERSSPPLFPRDPSVHSLEEKLRNKEEELNLLRDKLKVCQANAVEEAKEYQKLMDYIQRQNRLIQPGGGSNTAAEEDPRATPAPSHHQAVRQESKKNLESLKKDLQKAHEKLKTVEKREVEVKTRLELRKDASQEAVLDRIQELKRGRKIAQERCKTYRNKFEEIARDKVVLQTKIKELEGEITTMELMAKQSELEEEREKRRIQAQKILGSGRDARARQRSAAYDVTTPKRPYTGRPSPRKVIAQPTENLPSLVDYSGTATNPKAAYSRQVSMLSKQVIQAEASRPSIPNIPPANVRERCVLCGGAFPVSTSPGPHMDTHCHIHHHIIKDGKWDCCSSGYDSAGCLRVPHLRIAVVGRNQLLLTDGTMRTMWLNC